MDHLEACKRACRVVLQGFVMSLVFSIPVSMVFSFLPPTEYTLGGLYANIFLFATTALFIGIFVQIVWEKETITEPL